MYEILKCAFNQLLSNKLRTFLTMLGMLIGIAAVIIILSVGEGVKGYVGSEFEGAGKNAIEIKTSEYKEENMLTTDDIALLESIPEIKSAMQCHSEYYGSAQNYKQESKNILYYGFTPQIDEVSKLTLVSGRKFTDADVETASNVIIVEDNFSKMMYGREDPDYALGKSYELVIGGEKHTLEIVGIVESAYPDMVPLDQVPPIVYMPFTTADQFLYDGQGKSYEGYVVIKDGYNPADYVRLVKRLLQRQHGNKDVFSVSTVSSGMDDMNDMMDKLSIVISVVAGISLLVGGIGIMNIMLVTVKERTREIGIRKALGARDYQILVQFLIEAIVLTVLGGLSGMLIGYAVGILIAGLISVSAKLTLSMVILSVGISSFVGIVFGVFPAYKAAKLDPIVALRQE